MSMLKGTPWRVVYDICRRDPDTLQPVVLAENGGIETLEEAKLLVGALQLADREIDNRHGIRTYEIFPLVKHKDYGTYRDGSDLDELGELNAEEKPEPCN